MSIRKTLFQRAGALMKSSWELAKVAGVHEGVRAVVVTAANGSKEHIQRKGDPERRARLARAIAYTMASYPGSLNNLMRRLAEALNGTARMREDEVSSSLALLVDDWNGNRDWLKNTSSVLRDLDVMSDPEFWALMEILDKDPIAQVVKASIQKAPEIMRALDKGLAGIIRSIREPLGEALARKGIF